MKMLSLICSCLVLTVLLTIGGYWYDGYNVGHKAGASYALDAVVKASLLISEYGLTEEEATSPEFKRIILLKDNDEFVLQATVWAAKRDLKAMGK